MILTCFEPSHHPHNRHFLRLSSIPSIKDDTNKPNPITTAARTPATENGEKKTYSNIQFV